MGQISVARFCCLTSACRSPSLIGRDDAVVKVTPCMFGFGGFCRLLEVSVFRRSPAHGIVAGCFASSSVISVSVEGCQDGLLMGRPPVQYLE